jgi:hypothetical protein
VAVAGVEEVAAGEDGEEEDSLIALTVSEQQHEGSFWDWFKGFVLILI